MKNLAFIKKYIAFCVLFFIFCLVFLPQQGHGSDMNCWKDWTKYIFNHGLHNVYKSGTDYLPLYHYILTIFGLFKGSIENIEVNIHYLKLITLFFHFVTGYFLILLIKKNDWSSDKMIVYVLFYLLNIAVLYNSLIWGQVDEILTGLIFITCYFSLKQKVQLALIFLVFSINFKLQAIIFLPIVLLLLLPAIISTFSIKKLATYILFPLLIQVLIILPFIISGNISKLWDVVTGSMGKYPVVSMNAYNFWDFLLPGNLREIPDSNTYKGISYKHWGLLLFFVTSGLALFPLFKSVYLSIKSKTNISFPIDKFLLLCGIIPLFFFYFNTQMHERYSHPALVFLIAYSLYTKKPFVAIVVSCACFLNMEGVLKFIKLNNYETLIFNRDFISSLFLLAIVYIYIQLFELNLINIKNNKYVKRFICYNSNL